MQVVNYMVLIDHNEISVLFEWRPMNSTPSGRQTKEERSQLVKSARMGGFTSKQMLIINKP